MVACLVSRLGYANDTFTRKLMCQVRKSHTGVVPSWFKMADPDIFELVRAEIERSLRSGKGIDEVRVEARAFLLLHTNPTASAN